MFVPHDTEFALYFFMSSIIICVNRLAATLIRNADKRTTHGKKEIMLIDASTNDNKGLCCE